MDTELAAPFSSLLVALQSPLFQLGAQPVNVLWLAKCLLLMALVALLGRWTKRIFKHRVLIRFVLNEGDREVISSLAGFSAAALGFVVVLHTMGLKLESLAIIVGGLGVGIGFGLQDITKNLASGITLLGERKLRVGDLIEFNGAEGYIQEISMRSTVIRTFHGSQLVVPNIDLTSSQVENWSYPSRQGRLQIPLVVDHRSDLVLVTELLLRAAAAEPAVLAEPAPRAIFKGFGEYGLNFELWIWVAQIDNGTLVRSAVNFLIEYHLRQHGIKLAYRQAEPCLSGPEQPGSDTSPPTRSADSSIPVQPMARPLRDLLLALRYFENFDEIQLRGLIELGQRKRLAGGEILVEQGKYHPAFCVVLEGAIDAIYENDKISRRMFTFSVGDFFGELPLILKIPYPTTMRAVEETTLFVIGSDGFHQLLSRHPRIKDEVTEELTRRQENFELVQATLRTMGLMTEEQAANPVAWLRGRLRKLMGG